MPALDTNVLVKYLVADDKKQFESAKAFIEDATLTEPLFDPLSVTVELEWAPRSLYDVYKEIMLTVFTSPALTRTAERH